MRAGQGAKQKVEGYWLMYEGGICEERSDELKEFLEERQYGMQAV
jgi:hypothetical protein